MPPLDAKQLFPNRTESFYAIIHAHPGFPKYLSTSLAKRASVATMARRKGAIDREAEEAGLAALCVAMGELMEAEHERAVATPPTSRARRLEHVIRLRQIGSDIAALASAAEVLVRRGE